MKIEVSQSTVVQFFCYETKSSNKGSGSYAKTVPVKYICNNNHSFYDKDYFGYKNHHCLDFNTFSYACQQYVNY